MAFTPAQSGVVISAGLQKILLGSVSERVIGQAQCSVLWWCEDA